MDVEEAAGRMDLLGHNFFLFLNNETGTYNVPLHSCMRRHDNDYGGAARRVGLDRRPEHGVGSVVGELVGERQP